jgi:S1-C subfamily serine protease
MRYLLFLILAVFGVVGIGVAAAIPSFDSNEAPPVVAMKNATVKVYNDEGLGTGVIISKGHVVTANHVVAGSHDYMRIMLPNGHEKIGRIVWAGGLRHDIAMLEVDTEDFAPAHLRCSPVTLGETVYSYGFPLGIPNQLTKGTVANVDGITDVFAPADLHDLILASLPKGLVTLNLTLIPGNSGGGIWDADGNLVGLADLLVFPNLTAMVSTAGDLCPALGR